MKSFLFILAIFSVTSFGSPNLQAWGRQWVSSCGYYSASSAEIDFTFADDSLPLGTRVFLLSAWNGYYWMGGGPNSYRQHYTWKDQMEQEMVAISPFTWQRRVRGQIHGRTSNEFRTSSVFVFRVRVPGKPEYFVNGGSSWGHYEVGGLNPNAPCIDPNGGQPPGFTPWKIDVVSKN